MPTLEKCPSKTSREVVELIDKLSYRLSYATPEDYTKFFLAHEAAFFWIQAHRAGSYLTRGVLVELVELRDAMDGVKAVKS